MQARSLAVLITLTAAGAAACSHDRPEPRTAATAQPAPVAETEPTNARVEAPPVRADVIQVGPNLREACPIQNVQQAPKFDFDKSNLTQSDRDVLAQVAACLTTGRLKGRAVKLVGRADPRGEAEYNMGLGEQRAMSAKSYLEQLGVAEGRLNHTSRGAMDAQGHDEETWQIDRRVDIDLAP
jgi:peptidoglycan-associated lipoprotein